MQIVLSAVMFKLKYVHGGFADGLYRIWDDVHTWSSTWKHTATVNLADFLCR